jgi:4-amino-4-deoxychorismate lyase
VATARWLVDGRSDAGIAPDDRGLAYGDGLFETIAVRDGAPRLIERHLARLAAGCARLAIPAPSLGLLREEIGTLLDGAARGTLKLIVTRGTGPRGYAPPAAQRPVRALGFWPDESPVAIGSSCALLVCRTPASCNPALAGLKTLNRLDNVLARAEVAAAGAHEGVMTDGPGRIVGGTMTNLFIVRRGELLTPALSRAGVAGVMRAVVLEAASAIGLRSAETDMDVDELMRADEIFLTNALTGIWRVGRVAQRSLGAAPVTIALRARLRELGVDEPGA